MDSKPLKPTTKWEQLLEHLCAQIRSGQLPVGQKISTEEELATQFNVSRPTAGRALNELSKLGYVTRKPRVGTVVAEISPAVRHSIALIADRVAMNFDFPQADFIRGIQDVFGQEYSVALFDSHGSAHQESGHIRKATQSADGIILYPTCDPKNNALLASTFANGVPMVLVDRMPEGENFPAVLPDEMTATKEAVELMISRGHKKIAFLSFAKPEVTSVRNRHRAYTETMKAHGLPVLERFLPRDLETSDSAREEFLRDVVFALSQGAEKATAFFCVQDSIALGVLDTCEKMGTECPGAIEVACFNEWPAMMLGRPWDVHRIVRRKYEMGRLAALKVLAQINKQSFESTSRVAARVYPAEPGPSPLTAAGLSAWIQNTSQKSSH